jgi:hypothetical protein
VGTGHQARTWNYTLNITSVDLQSDSSLVVCDIASHVAKQTSRRGGPDDCCWAIPSADDAAIVCMNARALSQKGLVPIRW